MNKRIKAKLLKIAQEKMYIETFEVRNLSRLDFHDEVPVWGMEDALTLAYELGLKEGEKKAKK